MKNKLKRYEKNELTLNELKKLLILYHYPNDIYLESDMEREFIITEIKDCHGTPSTTIFSVNGSPPKGIGVLLRSSYTSRWEGQLILVGNGKISKQYWVEINKTS